MVERWQELASQHEVHVGKDATQAFVEEMAVGFGLAAAVTTEADAQAPIDAPEDASAASTATAQSVQGQVLEEVQSPSEPQDDWRPWVALSLMLGLILLGAGIQWRANARHSNP